jgi:MFS family permease
MRETCAWRIGKDKDIVVQRTSVKDTFKDMVHLLFLEPRTIALCLWVGTLTGIQYSFYSTLPTYFKNTFSLDGFHVKLTYVSLALGSIIGLLLYSTLQTQLKTWIMDYRSCSCSTDDLSKSEKSLPSRYRLLGALPVTFGCPFILIFFGFTFLPDAALFISLSLLVIYSAGSAITLLSVFQYLADRLTDSHEATILAVCSAIVHLTAASIALSFGPCISTLGMKVSFGVFSGASAVLGLIAWVVWFADRYAQRKLSKTF